MITETMLKRAATEADHAIIDSLPAPSECVHQFSSSFQRKMHHIFRFAKHPVIHQLPKYVAFLVLVLTLASSIWLSIDAEARAAFFTWVREQYESFVEYKFVGDTPEVNNEIVYELTWLPEGFSLQKGQHLDGGTYLTYTDNSGRRIIFSYLQGDDAASLFVASDYTERQSIKIGTVHADFYQANEESSANALVWLSEDDALSFCIMANLSEDIMIKLAEGVEKNN